jgi:hypothetical protein
VDYPRPSGATTAGYDGGAESAAGADSAGTGVPPLRRGRDVEPLGCGLSRLGRGDTRLGDGEGDGGALGLGGGLLCAIDAGSGRTRK